MCSMKSCMSCMAGVLVGGIAWISFYRIGYYRHCCIDYTGEVLLATYLYPLHSHPNHILLLHLD